MIKFFLLDSAPFFDTPYQLLGWLGWFLFAGIILWVVRRNSKSARGQHFWLLFLILGIGTILGASFIGLKIPFNNVIPLPNIPWESAVPVVMLLSAIPILLAGGMLGIWPAALFGFISGFISALWNTHSVFTPLETSALFVLLSLVLRQDYRTPIFGFLRRPTAAALLTIVFSVPIFLISTFFSTNGSLSAKLDYAFTQSWILVIVNGIPLLLAGLLCDLFQVVRSKYWVRNNSLRPSPGESGLQKRILYSTVPIVLVLLIALTIADWMVAGKAARSILEEQLKSSSQIAAENIPSILATGQSLTTSLVELDLPLNNTEKLQKILRSKIREVPFFSQIYVFDLTGAPLTGYPIQDIDSFHIKPEEESGIQLALDGTQMQHYIVAPDPGEGSALISFIATIPDEYGLARGVVIARTDLMINLFSQPAVLVLETIAQSGGQGAILDETNRILYHTNRNLIMSQYSQAIPQVSGYFEDAGMTGTRYMNFLSIDQNYGWKVILSMPASFSQDLAMRIAIPLLAISLIIAILAFLLLRLLMKSLTASLVHLANKADEISKGELDNHIDASGIDEIGRLGSAFEQMRVSLKSRLDELDALLKVSQGVASDLKLESSSSHLLKALLSYGADAASLVLTNSTQNGQASEFLAYRDGNNAHDFNFLDRILFEELKAEPIVIIPSKARIRRLGIPRGVEVPSALAAIALNTGDQESAFIWILYVQPHRFTDGEIRFLNTLAGQAQLAVTNSILFLKAEVGKKRLESVLTSTPEPVMVAGEGGQLLIINQAAEQLEALVSLESATDYSRGEIISKNLKQFILNTSQTESRVEEMELEDGHTYLVSVSPVEVEDQHVGKVCVLRDVTEYKQLEKMKSEYVSTVSHDLKGPLSLIRGYSSMLPMVGDMNAQQKEYSKKISDGIDEISRMADNLLDMRRMDQGIQLQVEKIAPAALLDYVIAELQPQVKNKKVQLVPELALSQDLTVEADKILLQRALYNLLENAIKFSPLGGVVNLRLQKNDNSVIFVIQDHGPGIAPIDVEKVFNQSKRGANQDGSLQKETGMGLSIVKSIAERHQGKVWVESQLGRGSTFYLEIPLVYDRK